MNKKYAFFGSPEFAAIILQSLIDSGTPPEMIICNPDKPTGRKKVITPPPAKVVAEKNGIKYWQPEILSEEGWDENVPLLDFGIVAAYAKIIPSTILRKMPLGVVGVHPSLLPKYRGASPIQSALLDGQKITGATLYLMDEKMDHGPILSQKELPIRENMSFSELYLELARLSGKLLLETVAPWIRGEINPAPQEESEATFTKKISTEDAFIDPAELKMGKDGDLKMAVKIHRRIQALNPEPGTWTMENGKRIKLLSSKLESGTLKITKIQVEGKKPKEI